ncbi:MAG: heavy-metal-associated domain-containing protein [Theionarchaea archaeon]|nr:heavy-metal-associated domain-containing protein [Theionarchaea archaeon]
MDSEKMTIQKVIAITGMHCESCKRLIESEIGLLNGVESIRVNLIENNALVQFNPQEISLEEIKSEITSLGYSTDGSTAKKNSLMQGLVYGLVPHVGCIAFIAASIAGATAAMNLFKPLLMNPFFFHVLILISLMFATVSSVVYLRKNRFLSLAGIKRKWKYLSIMYSSTVGVNLLFFMVIFPLLANVSISSVAGASLIDAEISSVLLQVDIPCPGHAPLISEELKSIQGIRDIRFSYPDIFDVKYDSTQTSIEEIISLEVFNVYKAVVRESDLKNDLINNQPRQSCGTGGCEGGCGCGASP